MIIAIGGVSRAGKSTLSRLLKAKIEALGVSVTIIEQDKYVYKEKDIPKIKDKVDWESPKSINFEKFDKAITSAGKKYDHVIVEGLLVYYQEKLVKKFSRSIFLKIPKTLFVTRKKIDLRWGSEPEPRWYINHIWESYKRYGELNLPKDIIKLTGKRKFDLDALAQQLDLISPAEKIFNTIANKFESRYKHVARGPMMSAPGIRYKTKNFAFFHKNEMTFKLGKKFNTKANGIKNVRHLSPFKTKPPLKAWYIISSDQKEIWEELTQVAFEYIQQELG